MKSTILFLLISLHLSAQTEASFSFGASTFLGDVGGNRGMGKTFLKDLQLSQVHPAFRFSFTRDGITLSYLHTVLSGADSTIKNREGAEVGRLVRGFYFSTPLHEVTITGRKFYGPFFITGGFGLLHFNTQQQEKKVAKIQPLVLYGFGARVPISETVSLNLSAEGRSLFTDYIDGVSKRGDPKQNDSYVLALVGVAVRFQKNYLGCPKMRP